MTDDHPSCCAGSREAIDETPDDGSTVPDLDSGWSTRGGTSGDDRTKRMVRIGGETFVMGTDSDVGFPEDGEGPTREVTVSPFFIDKHAVTNAEFLEFVKDTGYTTDAERYGWSFVFQDFVDSDDQDAIMQNVPAAPWWVAVRGATWLRPEGPSSSVLESRLTHPVTQVSWHDAVAYAEWAGKRLPTEAEWEYAARGGCTQNRFPWGDELHPDGEHRCNIWQGEFPDNNTGDDGYIQTAPVDAFPPNGHGLYNVSGNVWEWCLDWFSTDDHTTDAFDSMNPKGPATGNQRVMRGGSYLCHRSWCNRYRVAARSKNTPDSSTGNIGFRCVVDVDESNFSRKPPENVV